MPVPVVEGSFPRNGGKHPPYRTLSLSRSHDRHLVIFFKKVYAFYESYYLYYFSYVSGVRFATISQIPASSMLLLLIAGRWTFDVFSIGTVFMRSFV